MNWTPKQEQRLNDLDYGTGLLQEALDKLEEAGRYLKNHSRTDMARDMIVNAARFVFQAHVETHSLAAGMERAKRDAEVEERGRVAAHTFDIISAYSSVEDEREEV